MPGSVHLFGALDTSLSALRAQRERMDIASANLANAESTRTPEGGPYQRRQVVFEAMLNEARDGSQVPAGVHVASITKDPRPAIPVHMPGHPEADANGMVMMPDIRTGEEMGDMIGASRSYEANAAAFKMSRGMYQKALELGRA